MGKRLRSHVCGAWHKGSGDAVAVYNPTTGEQIAEVDNSGLDHKAALQYAREVGGPVLRSMSFTQRGELLMAMAGAWHEHRDELLDLSTESGGNTRGDAKFDIDGATGTLSAYARIGAKLGEARFLIDGESIRLSRSPRFVGRHVRMPRTGAAIHINAFNFPAWGMAEKMAAAILGGMPVVTKPATSTAVLAERMIEILVNKEVVPAGIISFICGSAGDMLNHVITQDVVAFTGSADTGCRIRSGAAVIKNSVRVNVEADSLNSAVLGPDVKHQGETWDLFIREVCTDMTQKAGQKCTAIRRIFVPEDKVEEVTADLIETLSSTRVGNPATRGVRMGPLASASQLQDIRSGISELQAVADIVHGEVGPGELMDTDADSGYFQQPVLLLAKDPANAGIVHEREVFGPVATILPYSGDAEQAAALMNLGDGGLVASVYSDKRDFAASLIEAVAPYNGRLNFGSKKVAEFSMGPGAVLPTLIHGGPGRAGAGEELGGIRGLSFYMQRTALQGDEPMLARLLEDGVEV
ncbi:MAG: 3,4-dehydroadipyl-CoA semialdehyde dehydrogenase [Planctomycetota bacterium]|jgi:oxepin-CoA hydrolase/3-oxo-5,6-dehydrosuberyl-CoA semialdehyde dehydrogenase|nr:3,4-dehydroadipyl-CoA semialdehyde dehydrogenase [Planctomycetota bacterium]